MSIIAEALFRPLRGIVCMLAASVFLTCSVQSFARTAACPCGVCPCAPCTCGGSSGSNDNHGSKKVDHGSKNIDKPKGSEGDKHVGKSHDGGREKGHGHHGDGGHGSIGVGVSVDLGGIGQRKAEADPFAVGGPPVAQTREKPENLKTKNKDRDAIGTKTDPFSNIELTGEQAKTDRKTASAR